MKIVSEVGMVRDSVNFGYQRLEPHFEVGGAPSVDRVFAFGVFVDNTTVLPSTPSSQIRGYQCGSEQ